MIILNSIEIVTDNTPHRRLLRVVPLHTPWVSLYDFYVKPFKLQNTLTDMTNVRRENLLPPYTGIKQTKILHEISDFSRSENNGTM